MVTKQLNLHDYEILGLELSGSGSSKSLTLKVKSEDQKAKVINFDQISFLDCSNFSWQNIISEIEIVELSSLNKAELRKKLEDAGIDLKYKAVDIEKVSGTYYVEIQASVGAQLVLICSGFLDQ